MSPWRGICCGSEFQFILFLAALWAGTAQAQVDTGSILGTVRDTERRDRAGREREPARVHDERADHSHLRRRGELRRDAAADRRLRA